LTNIFKNKRSSVTFPEWMCLKINSFKIDFLLGIFGAKLLAGIFLAGKVIDISPSKIAWLFP